MWDMAANDDVRQQHLLSQINSLEGKLAAIQASHATGTGHPLATFSRSGHLGNSLVRKRTIGLDGYPKSNRKKTDSQRQQQQASQEAATFALYM
ncbi:hypothetical protein ABBQ32_009667 [Trebouxia sp. C0010 RCD-2024]